MSYVWENVVNTEFGEISNDVVMASSEIPGTEMGSLSVGHPMEFLLAILKHVSIIVVMSAS
jgi:hypothetical protein